MVMFARMVVFAWTRAESSMRGAARALAMASREAKRVEDTFIADEGISRL